MKPATQALRGLHDSLEPAELALDDAPAAHRNGPFPRAVGNRQAGRHGGIDRDLLDLDPWGWFGLTDGGAHLFLASIVIMAANVVIVLNARDDTFTLDAVR